MYVNVLLSLATTGLSFIETSNEMNHSPVQ